MSSRLRWAGITRFPWIYDVAVGFDLTLGLSDLTGLETTPSKEAWNLHPSRPLRRIVTVKTIGVVSRAVHYVCAQIVPNFSALLITPAHSSARRRRGYLV